MVWHVVACAWYMAHAVTGWWFMLVTLVQQQRYSVALAPHEQQAGCTDVQQPTSGGQGSDTAANLTSSTA